MRLPACWCWFAEEAPAEADTITPVAVGKKAEVAHAVKAVRKDMKEKAPHKLVGMKAHDLLTITAVATIILPSKGDMVAFNMSDTAVCDCDTMGVSAEIGEHLIWTAEWRLRIDDPIDAASAGKMADERVAIVEMSEFVEELQFVSGKGFRESG